MKSFPGERLSVESRGYNELEDNPRVPCRQSKFRGLKMSDTHIEDQTWGVWRQDDNGNQFLVESGLDKETALRLMKEYENRKHKQVYWRSHNKV